MSQVLGIGARISLNNELGRAGKAFHGYERHLAEKGLSKEHVLDALKEFHQGVTLVRDINVRIMQAALQETHDLFQFVKKHEKFFKEDPEAHAEIIQVLKDIAALIFGVEDVDANLKKESEALKHFAA